MNVLKYIVKRVKKRNAATQKECYEESGNKDGTCYGYNLEEKYICGGISNEERQRICAKFPEYELCS